MSEPNPVIDTPAAAPEEVKRKKVAYLHLTAEFPVNDEGDIADITTLVKETMEALRGIGEVKVFKLKLPAHEVKL